MAMNKIRIRLVSIRNHGRNHELFCDKTLMLRTARKPGDEETVNHYVLGRLYEHEKSGEISFIKL